jgi:hypothetical protein
MRNIVHRISSNHTGSTSWKVAPLLLRSDLFPERKVQRQWGTRHLQLPHSFHSSRLTASINLEFALRAFFATCVKLGEQITNSSTTLTWTSFAHGESNLDQHVMCSSLTMPLMGKDQFLWPIGWGMLGVPSSYHVGCQHIWDVSARQSLKSQRGIQAGQRQISVRLLWDLCKLWAEVTRSTDCSWYAFSWTTLVHCCSAWLQARRPQKALKRISVVLLEHIERALQSIGQPVPAASSSMKTDSSPAQQHAMKQLRRIQNESKIFV